MSERSHTGSSSPDQHAVAKATATPIDDPSSNMEDISSTPTTTSDGNQQQQQQQQQHPPPLQQGSPPPLPEEQQNLQGQDLSDDHDNDREDDNTPTPTQSAASSIFGGIPDDHIIPFERPQSVTPENSIHSDHHDQEDQNAIQSSTNNEQQLQDNNNHNHNNKENGNENENEKEEVQTKTDNENDNPIPLPPPLPTSSSPYNRKQESLPDPRSGGTNSSSTKPLGQSSSSNTSSELKQKCSNSKQQQYSTGSSIRTASSHIEKFTLYETKQRFYVVASYQSEPLYRVLKIDRAFTFEDPNLPITDDDVLYTKDELNDLLNMISDGNKTTGGMQKTIPLFYGIAGFVRFTAGWYMVVIRKKATVGLIGGHYIYHCEATQNISISETRAEKTSEENRLLTLFQQVDLSKNFYFSYSYDLTNTLQNNMLGLNQRNYHQGPSSTSAWGYNSKFLWNHRLLKPAFKAFDCKNWVVPLVYGFVDQAKLDIYGRTVYITLIARRSRHFAGARFLKRGVDDEGHVANDVETEQIVSDALITPFHLPVAEKEKEAGPKPSKPSRRPSPRYTSYVQYRGSIPLKWSQDVTNMTPKPMIDIALVDPFHMSAALHFDDLFSRYGTPVFILNLIKSKERTPRESKLLHEYSDCIRYLNQFLPEKNQIIYRHFDIAWENKYGSTDVISQLEDLAGEALYNTNFFHSGPSEITGPYTQHPDTPLLQQGICRVNCIDCLDRTNAAQFVIGKTALAYQLKALGIIKPDHIPFDSDAINILTEMYHDHGDTIALQYGGSHLAHTMATYRKINQWTSHSRDMIEGLRRFYANSFADQEKQAAIDLFLGIDDNKVVKPVPRRYRNWYTSAYLEPRVTMPFAEEFMRLALKNQTDYWLEYYRPKSFSEFAKLFVFKVNSTNNYSTIINNNQNNNNNNKKDNNNNNTNNNNNLIPNSLSPFVKRIPHRNSNSLTSGTRRHIVNGVYNWVKASVNRPSPPLKKIKPLARDEDDINEPKAKASLYSESANFAMHHLRPRVENSEEKEYRRYVHQYSHNYINRQQHPIESSDARAYRSYINYQENVLSSDCIHGQDLDIYENSILTGTQFTSNGPLNVDEHSILLYEDSCLLANESIHNYGFDELQTGHVSSVTSLGLNFANDY